MAENLETLRKQRNMKAGQLAAKSGVPIKQIAAYEKGERIKATDMPKLARALFVDESQINWVSVPPPPPPPKPVVEKPKKVAPPEKPQAETPDKPEASEKPHRPKQQWGKKGKTVEPARPSQIDHALILAAKIGDDEAAVTEKAGKPLTELTLPEASRLIMDYQKAWLAYKATRPPGHPATHGNQGKRAVTPEAVDRYEMDYLQARQDAGDDIAFTLFDGSVQHGRITGFSPYAITIQQPDGAETTLHKLGIVYYSVIGNQ